MLVFGVIVELGLLYVKLFFVLLFVVIFIFSLVGYMLVWELLFIYVLGTFWYGLFNWFWFWIWCEQLLCELLSLLYCELVDYCEVKYSLFI